MIDLQSADEPELELAGSSADAQQARRSSETGGGQTLPDHQTGTKMPSQTALERPRAPSADIAGGSLDSNVVSSVSLLIGSQQALAEKAASKASGLSVSVKPSGTLCIS